MSARKTRESFEVFLDSSELGGLDQIGTLYRQAERTELPAPFAYTQAWLDSRKAFMLDPRLELYSDEQYPPSKAVTFGIFMDSAPDRWGRVLMERREAVQADKDDRPMRTLQEIDFLLGVHDLTRVGALRFRDENKVFQDDSANAAPPVTDLGALATIAIRLEDVGIEKMPEYEQWLAVLIAPGTSLGGARPKANFTNLGNELWIAKFPAKDDRYDVGAWEYLVHGLARSAGIWVPKSQLKYVGTGYGTFCVERFDRSKGSRRMYASAMTMLERRDGDTNAGYPDLAEFLSDGGAQGHIGGDLEQLFRRLVFNVLIGNRDDHLRNHGFIREPTGWRLSPAFDMNPNASKLEHTLSIDGKSAAPDMNAVLETAAFYRLTEGEAEQVIADIRKVVATWRDEAARLKLSRQEIQRMEPVFARFDH